MAKSLNRSRIRSVALAILFFMFVAVFTQPSFESNHWSHETIDLVGSILIILCVLGRVYSTAFIGGHKNAALITYGPFSVCRNPLYFCSFLGAVGVGIATNHLILMIAAPLVFCLIFTPVIKREEAFLTEKFGEEYSAYRNKTPKCFPNFSLYHTPESVPMQPEFLLNAVKDATLWLLAVPMLELVEYLQDIHTINPLL